jgi:hypothetical protein
MEDNDNPIIIRPYIVFRDRPFNLKVLWLGCRFCRPSVNTICGRIMIGLSLLSFVSKHKMWSYYDLVYCNPSVRLYDKNSESDFFFSSTKIWIFFSASVGIRIFVLEKNHNPPFQANWSFPYWRTKTLQVKWSVPKHNIWSYYDWVVVVFHQ